jgi:hypothetical protein
VTTFAQTISKNYIQMNLIQNSSGARNGTTLLALSNGGEFTKGRDRITAIDEFGILRCDTKVCVVLESAVTKELVDLIGGQMARSVRSVWGITRPDGSRCGLITREERTQRSFRYSTRMAFVRWEGRKIVIVGGVGDDP